jgi:hypothetical protein
MSITKALTKSIALRMGVDVTHMMTQANVEVSRDNPESQFVTAFAAVLDADCTATPPDRRTRHPASEQPPHTDRSRLLWATALRIGWLRVSGAEHYPGAR